MIKSGKFDSVFTAHEEHWVPRWDIYAKPIEWDLKNRPRRQDMPVKFVENGMMYITTKKSLLENQLRYGGKIGILEIPIIDSFQIDSIDDLNLIKKLTKKFMNFKNITEPYLIAEIGINHNGDIEIAKKLIDATNATGWNCCKF